jgi:glycosyltransferase involved in cell wall biosynthesis
MSQTNPPLVVPLVALAAKLWHKPYFLIAMDLYPEVLVAHGSLSRHRAPARILAAVFGWAYRHAARVVALGPVMAERIREKGVEDACLIEISNWSTGASGVVRGQANRIRSELGLQDCFVLVYSGNLGLGHEFETLLRGLAIALERVPALKIVFIGKGPRLAEVQQLVQDLKLESSVMFSAFVPASQLPETMGLADLGIVTLRDGFEGLIVPSKLLGYLSRGVPILYIGPRSDVDVLVSQHDCGFSIRCGDSAAVSRAIIAAYQDRKRLQEMGEAGRVAYQQGLSRDHGLSRYESAVRECLDVRSRVVES